MRWKLQFDAHTWEAPLDAATLLSVAAWAGTDEWTVMDPVASPTILTAYYVILLAQAEQVTPEVAAGVVMRRSMLELVNGHSQGG